MRGISHLKAANVRFNTLTVVNRQNSCHPLETYNFLRDVGAGYMQFIPVVERVLRSPAQNGLVLIGPGSTAPAAVSDWTVEPEAYGLFLCAIFDEWVRNDVGKYFVQLFEVTLELWLGMPPKSLRFRRDLRQCARPGASGRSVFLRPYVYPENRLGNILDSPLASLAIGQQQTSFGLAKRHTLPAYCRQCDVRFACNGECPKHRFMHAPDGEPGLNYLCAAYKRFFRHIAPYMEFMGWELLRGQPPARVMEYARWVDNQLRDPSHSPNVGK